MSSDFIRRKCGLHFSTNHTVVDAEVAFPSATSVNNELPRIVSATSESKAEDTPSQPTIKSSLTFGDLLSNDESEIRAKKLQKLDNDVDLWNVDTTAIAKGSTPTKKISKNSSTSPGNLSPRLCSTHQVDCNVLNDGDYKPNFDASRAKWQAMQPLEVSAGKWLHKYYHQFLFDHQVDGIKWMWSNYSKGTGFILGDDMGMGKTSQLIGLLSIIFDKTGAQSEDCRQTEQRTRTPEGFVRPALIVVPASLINNWFDELNAWGYFSFRKVGRTRDEQVETLHALRRGTIEGAVMSYDTMKSKIDELKHLEFSVVVFDEAHKLKSKDAQVYQAALTLKKSRCNVLLTGTILQNNVSELWTLCNICKKGRDWMDFREFEETYTTPITQSMKSTATIDDIERGNERKEMLYQLLSGFHIRRDKSKDDIIVMCELSAVQKALMMECLAFPDVQVMIGQAEPETVFLDEDSGESGINPLAVIWRLNHPDDERCKMCSAGTTCKCIFYPTMSKLLKIVSHPSSLQVDRRTLDDKKRAKQMAFLRAFAPETVAMLPGEGGGLYLSERWTDLTNITISGKMEALANMLDHFYNTNCKTLIFSGILRVLDCIGAYIKSKGRSYTRIDGNVSVEQRQSIVYEFQTKSQTLLPYMLMSTEVGGLGFNLTAASKVIIFDVNWNPTKDQQSQDRAYRIGQKEKVSVYRLVAKGTIEEIQYMRQLYKQELAINIVKGEDGGRIFDGVEGLTGIKNLFRYQEGSFFQQIKEKFGLDSNRPAAAGSSSSSSSNVAKTHPESDSVSERESRKQRLSATGEWLRNNSINQQMVEKAMVDSDADTYHFLQSIGIDPKNVHQNEEMLKARYDDEDAINSRLGEESSILNYFGRIPSTISTDTGSIPAEVAVKAAASPAADVASHMTSSRYGIPGLNTRGNNQSATSTSPSKLYRPSYMDNEK